MGMNERASFSEVAEERRQAAREKYEAEVRRRAAELAAIDAANRIRASLLAATDRIIRGSADREDLDLIVSKLAAWKELLQKNNDYDVGALIGHLARFPMAAQAVITELLPFLKLKAFSFNEGLVTKRQLHELLAHTNSAHSVLTRSINSPLTTKLSEFLEKLSEAPLSDKQILCLQRIVDDYTVRLLGQDNSVDQLTIQKLLLSKTLRQLHPRTELTAGMTINMENFPDFLSTLKERVALLPLNPDTRITMSQVILPGIEALTRDEDKIVEHVTTNFGVLYFLNEKLPLHTDHTPKDALTPQSDPDAYRETLHRLLGNLFGAAEIAHNKGRLGEFCEKISVGYCFEGRVRDTFTWVASLSNIATFAELMEKYILKEHASYAEVMFNQTIADTDATGNADPVLDFIMARHLNAPCVPDSTYAPGGKVTQIGVKKFLANIYYYRSQRECEQAISSAQSLKASLEKETASFWSRPWADAKRAKILALNALVDRIVINKMPPYEAAAAIKREFPTTLHCFFSSRTKTLVERLEAGGQFSVNMK